MFSPAIRRMIATGAATIGPPVRVLTQLRNPVISAGTQVADLDLPPSTNNLFFNAKGNQKGRIKTPEYRAWEAAAVPVLAALVPVKLLPFRIRYTLYGGRGLNKARDLGNIEKPITDAMVTACIIPGDSLAAGLYGLSLEFSNQDEGHAFVRVELMEGINDG